MSRTPSIYVDTNICRDCIKRRNFESIHLMGTIRDKKWKCVTSGFTLMELFDIEKDDLFAHKKIRLGWEINKIVREKPNRELTKDELKEITEVMNNFYSNFNNIMIETLDENGWKMAYKMCAYSSLTAPDVIHLAVAWQAKCNIIVTSDQRFIKHGNNFLKDQEVYKNLRICDVTNMFKQLKEMSFRI